MTFRARPGIPALAAAAAIALSACQTTPMANPRLEGARAALSQARANPDAARAAAIELDRAQQALQRAELAWSGGADSEEVDHLAYLAQRQALVAQAVGVRAQAEARLQQAGVERERILLEARTREAEASAAAARSAQAGERSAQASARSAQGQAAQSQQEAETARQQAAREAERAAALERDLQTLQARSTQRGLVVTMGDVLFTTGQATLQPGARRNVDQLARVMQQYAERRVLVEGFTDSVGSEDLNLQLSQRRAEAFSQALVGAGVPSERIAVRAHGEAFPVAGNDTPAGRQQNRRVEVLFSDAQGRFAER